MKVKSMVDLKSLVTGSDEELQEFTTHAIRTKEQVLACIAQARRALEREQASSTLPGRYFSNYYALLERFRSSVEAMALFDNLEPWWSYQVLLDETGATLYLCFGKPNTTAMSGVVLQTGTLLEVKCKLLTVEEYAEMRLVEPVTVRQWLRRGKILSAQKLGVVWKIPELAIVEGKQPGVHVYSWNPQECVFGEDLKILQNYQSCIISKAKEGKNYKIRLIKATKFSDGTPNYDDTYFTAKEKELLELQLLEHPQVSRLSTKYRHYVYAEEANDDAWRMDEQGVEKSIWCERWQQSVAQAHAVK